MPSAIILGQGGGGGGGGSSNASVGLTGHTAPTSATEIGDVVAGNLVAISATNPVPVSATSSPNSSLNPIYVSGGGGGTQYTDETAESAGAFVITVAGLYNGTDVVGLRGDSSNNLFVNLATAIPAGSNIIGQVEITDGTNILGTSTHPVRIDPTGTTVQPTEVYQGASPVGSANPLYVQFETTPAFSGNITEWNSVALGSPTAFGTEPSGNVIGVNAEVFQGASVVGSGNPLYTQFASAQAVTLTSTTITGTVAVTQSTSPWVVSGTITFPASPVVWIEGHGGAVVDGVITAATAPANGLAVLGVYNSSLPTLTTGQSAAIQVDAAGQQLVDLNYYAGVALGAAANYGTSPGAVKVAGVNAFITNTVPVTLTSTTITGTVAVTQSTSPWIVAGGGTAGSPGTAVLTVQGISGGTAITVGGALTNNNAAPAANNIGVLSALINSASPTFTEGDQSLLSVDTTGRQRVRGTLSSNSNVPSSDGLMVLSRVANAAAPTFTEGDLVLASCDLSGNTRVVVTPASGTIYQVAPTSAANTKTNPFFTNITDGTNDLTAALSAWGTAPTGTEVMGVNSNLFIAGTIAATAASGVQKVGVVGNAGAAFDAATNAAPPANAIQMGAVASTTLPTSTTAGDLVAPMADIAGRLIVRSAGPRERMITNGITITASTGSNTLVAAGAAGVFRDLTFLQGSNGSATGTLMTISDGTVSYIYYMAPNGGGFNVNFDPPLRATTAATAWTATCGTSVSSVYISAQAAETK